MEILHLRSSFLSTVSITRLNNVGESGLPCFTPLSTLNSDAYALFAFTFAVVFSRVSLTNLISLGGILFRVKESNILFLLITVESVCIIYKYVTNINVIFIALFNNLPYEDTVDCGSIGSESRLIVT